MSPPRQLDPSGLQLACELEPDRHADQHAQARLLRNEHAERAEPLVGILLARRPRAIWRLVRILEPAALLERLVDDALQAGAACVTTSCAWREAVGIAQRLDGGVDLLGGVRPSARSRPQASGSTWA